MLLVRPIDRSVGGDRGVVVYRPRMLVSVRRIAVLHDVERVAMVIFHADRTQNGAQRVGGAALLADHLADVGVGHMQAQHGALFTHQGLHLDGFSARAIWVTSACVGSEMLSASFALSIRQMAPAAGAAWGGIVGWRS
jgi:hypothetical protein